MDIRELRDFELGEGNGEEEGVYNINQRTNKHTHNSKLRTNRHLPLPILQRIHAKNRSEKSQRQENDRYDCEKKQSSVLLDCLHGLQSSFAGQFVGFSCFGYVGLHLFEVEEFF